MQDVDALLLGRRTNVIHAEAFQPMAPGDPFGDLMNAPKKYVVSASCANGCRTGRQRPRYARLIRPVVREIDLVAPIVDTEGVMTGPAHWITARVARMTVPDAAITLPAARMMPADGGLMAADGRMALAGGRLMFADSGLTHPDA
jgi:hypothetical protein